MVGLLGAAVLSGCADPGFFRTDELLTVTEISTKLVPTSTVITSVTNPSTVMSEDDVYEVGKDVIAGRYVTVGPATPGSQCGWGLLPNKDAPFDQWLSYGSVRGPGRLAVSLGDIIETTGGCRWTLEQ